MLFFALLLAGGPRQHRGPPPPARVQRVVTLAPSLSEMVLALGAQDTLVGVTRFDDDPRTAKLPRIGGYNDPQPEAVLAVKPDLVLAEPAPANRGPVETLARLGVPVEAFPLSTVAEIEAAIEGIAGLLGLAEKGKALDAEIETARAQARAAASGKPRVKPLPAAGRAARCGARRDCPLPFAHPARAARGGSGRGAVCLGRGAAGAPAQSAR